MDINIIKFETRNSNKYNIKIIWNSMDFVKALGVGYLLELYYLVLQKS